MQITANPAQRDRGARIPNSFVEYVRSIGPGLVAVLTWLGAGDIVNSATAGGNYGYALMWAFALCLLIRYLFVSIIAKYQLCNQYGESVLGGLTRLHRWYAPLIFICSIMLGHAVGTYMVAGVASACANLSGFRNIRFWAVAVCLLAFSIAFRPIYRRLEKAFFVLAALLSVSLIGLALWSRPSPIGIIKGVFGFALPETMGQYGALFIILSLVGSVGGGLANLMYPYFAREKGWVTPAHRRVQQYDLILGILVIIILDLSVWVVGAQVLHPRGLHVSNIEDLARLLGVVLGRFGTNLFYIGIIAALFGPIVGNGAAFGYLGSDAYFHFRPSSLASYGGDYKKHPLYRWIAAWTILSPLLWILFGNADFVGLTLLVNTAQVILIPILVVGLGIITARAKFIGEKYKNRWWENVFVGFLLLLGLVGTYFSVMTLGAKLASLFR
jgi:Mn2+/Fe2+ NRAMP family transporter